MPVDGSERREFELNLERTLPVAQAAAYDALTDSASEGALVLERLDQYLRGGARR